MSYLVVKKAFSGLTVGKRSMWMYWFRWKTLPAQCSAGYKKLATCLGNIRKGQICIKISFNSLAHSDHFQLRTFCTFPAIIVYLPSSLQWISCPGLVLFPFWAHVNHVHPQDSLARNGTDLAPAARRTTSFGLSRTQFLSAEFDGS